MNGKRFVLSISYGNYISGAGGTDKVILAHRELLNSNNIDMVHIYRRTRRVPGVKGKRGDIWHMTFNGIDKGVFITHGVMRFISKLCAKGYSFDMIYIHHFMNVNISELKKITGLCDTPITIYVHDYMTICPNGGLVSSDNSFCGAGKPDEKKCAGCAHYDGTVKRMLEIEEFIRLNENRITFIAPSDAAKRVWCTVYPQYEKKLKVIYHQKLIGEYTENMKPLKADENIKIGFVGYQKDHKGWRQWIEAVKAAHEKGVKAEFYHFGSVSDHYEYIKEVSVDFKKDLCAMTDALRRYKIDCAVLWSTLPETYAYTYYEALAANTFILTNSESGNICDQVKARGNGIAAADINALKDILSDDRGLRKKINAFRREKNCGPLKLCENDEFIECIKPVNSKVSIKGFSGEPAFELRLTFISLAIKLKRYIKGYVKKTYQGRIFAYIGNTGKGV